MVALPPRNYYTPLPLDPQNPKSDAIPERIPFPGAGTRSKRGKEGPRRMRASFLEKHLFLSNRETRLAVFGLHLCLFRFRVD